MSDDFDKEAERQRLREKYERDKEDRESTERMSELLLQGATMTNRHCDTCGSPIFRYQGQEFCPNCQMETEEGQAAHERSGTATRAEDGDATAATATDQQPTQPPQSDRSQAGTQSQQPDRPQGGQSQSRQPPNQSTSAPGQQPGPTDPAASAPGQEAAAPVDGDSLDETQAALAQTLARFSQLAASTDDPHRAREYLETAKAAAETLSALPR